MGGSEINLDALIENDKGNEDIKSNPEVLEIYSERHPFSLALRINNFENEAMYKKFVKNCEMTIRRSIEYKDWRNYIVDVLQINECQITHERMDEVTVEVHHHLPSLYVLVTALVNKHIEENNEFCTFDICQEAIVLHFQNRVGYVTLLKSMHEKFHNGRLDVPIEFVNGNYNKFIQEYSKFLDEGDIETIQSRLSIKEHNCAWTRNDYQAEEEKETARG
ncbi:MAG: hypothetical protein DRI84_04320 [Bacteroidetes bacterium]|nr:MAG: hypothetical protein DRI84_04320 [Bacteroidota bacterium]